MIFEKSYNNSAALVKDEAGVEWKTLSTIYVAVHC